MGTFLDISKPFDSVWYDGLIHKTITFGILSSRLKLIDIGGYF